MVDRARLTDHLHKAEQHIAIGERNIARQQKLIVELERDGHNTKEARGLLKQFEELQAMHIEDLHRVLAELEI